MEYEHKNEGAGFVMIFEAYLLILDVKSLQQYWDGWVTVFGMQPATQANSASCPMRDRK